MNWKRTVYLIIKEKNNKSYTATLQIQVSLSFTKLMFQALVSNFGDVCFTGPDTDVFVDMRE